MNSNNAYWTNKINNSLGVTIKDNNKKLAFANELLMNLSSQVPFSINKERKKDYLKMLGKNIKKSIKNLNLLNNLIKEHPIGSPLMSAEQWGLKKSSGKNPDIMDTLQLLENLEKRTNDLIQQTKKTPGPQTIAASNIGDLVAGLYWNHFNKVPAYSKQSTDEAKTIFDRVCDVINEYLQEYKRSQLTGRISERVREKACNQIKKNTLNKKYKYVRSFQY